MDIRDIRGLKERARRALESASYDPKKLILIHTGVSVVLTLILALVDGLLSQQIDHTGGLSGVGNRAILQTAQEVLMYAQLAATLFWQIGYVYISLLILRQKPLGPADLLQGFRQFGPVLRLRLMEGLMCTGMALTCVYGAAIVFDMTPWAEPFEKAMEAGTEEALLQAAGEYALPLSALVAVFFLVLMVPYLYRLRMTSYLVMDNPQMGARMAIRTSRMMMFHNRRNLLKVDLSFWWFYLLQWLLTMVAYGDQLLPLFGVELPWSGEISYYLCLILCCLGQLALYWWKGNEVQVTYAACYEALLPKEQENERISVAN